MDISRFTSRNCTQPQTAGDLNRIAKKWYPSVRDDAFQHSSGKNVPGSAEVSKQDVDSFAIGFMGKSSGEQLGAMMGDLVDTLKYFTGIRSEVKKYDHFLDDLASSCKAP